MGQCLRGKMTEAGLIPTPAAVAATTPEVAPAGEVAVVTPEPETPAAEPATDVATPALDVTPPKAPEAVPENLIAATFGLLRAEPDGSVVIAGSGTPGSEVEVYSNGSLLGKATVETTGDWVLVPDAPLPTGGVELTLGEAGKTGRAAESFVVAIADDKTSQPLVVASTPGAASEILQGLQPPAIGATTEVAAAADPATPAVPTAVPAEPAAPLATPSEAAVPAVPAEAPTTVPPTEAAAVAPAPTDAPALAATEPASDAGAPTTAPPVETAATASAEPTVATAEPVVEPATVAGTDAVAAVATTQVTPTVVLDGTPPTIDAIELEGSKTFFAGGGPEGATMRLYVDDVFIADAKVEGGRWLVEAGKVLTNPSQRVRIDMLQPDSAKVASRAEVNFVIEMPAEAAPVAVAQAEPPAQPEPVTPAAEPAATPNSTTSATEPTAVSADPSPVEPAPVETAPAVPAPAADKAVEPVQPDTGPVVAESDDKTIEPVVAALDATPGPEQAVASEPVAAAEPVPVAEPVEPAAPAEPVVAAEATPSVEPAPTAETTPPTEVAAAPAAEPVPDVPTMVAVAIGAPDAERFVSGKAIIRRGDNLWTIARRTYGEGIKYTTIYQANTGQIRDPDRIYPGQVFDLPEGAAN